LFKRVSLVRSTTTDQLSSRGPPSGVGVGAGAGPAASVWWSGGVPEHPRKHAQTIKPHRRRAMATIVWLYRAGVN
jgi:hypothetical protein